MPLTILTIWVQILFLLWPGNPICFLKPLGAPGIAVTTTKDFVEGFQVMKKRTTGLLKHWTLNGSLLIQVFGNQILMRPARG